MTTATTSALWSGEPYLSTGLALHVVVLGTAAPQGSKAFKGVRRDGSAVLVESSKALKPWRALVQACTETAMRATGDTALFPLLGPLAIELCFTMPKPKSAPKSRVTYPITRPDVDKLARACLDAITYARTWNDDSQVVALHAYKVYPAETPRALTRPGVTIAVHTLASRADVPPPATRADVQLLLTEEASP